MTPQRRARRPWPHCRGGHAGFGALVVVWLLSTPGEAQAQASIQATTPFSSWDTIQISGSVQTDGDFEDWCAQNNCYILDKVAWADVGGGGGFQGGHYESWGSDEVAFQTTDTGPPQTMQARTYYVQGGVTWTFCINLPPSCETYTDQHDEHWNAQFTAQPATTIDSFAPTSGSGGAQTFSMQIGNPAGANDLYVVLLRVSQTAGWPPWANECVVRYWRPTNTLEIIDDAGNGGGSAVVGTGGWLENSRCRANAAGATAVLGGTTLTLTIPMEFKPLYAGAKNLYVLAYNMAQQGILWKDVGDWTVTVPCQYTVTPGSPSLASSSGNLTFSIATTPECPWSAPATSGFLTRTTGGSGSGAGQVSYSYPENPNTSPRSTQPTIASQAITVTQVGDGQNPAGDEVVYYHHDAIGSVRVVSDASGNPVRRHDFLPFGQEWQPIVQPDSLLFTGKERDKETGLDYFGARYYIASLERFTTVDPNFASATLLDPQSFNGYAYARNNPLKFVDPDGRLFEVCPTDSNHCDRVPDEEFYEFLDNLPPIFHNDPLPGADGLLRGYILAFGLPFAVYDQLYRDADPGAGAAPPTGGAQGGGGQSRSSEVTGTVVRPLNVCEKTFLLPYTYTDGTSAPLIHQTDLNAAILHINKVPWYLHIFPGSIAIARGNNIFFKRGRYTPRNAEGLALLGHELIHVRQYRQEGLNAFKYIVIDGLLRQNKYESPAYQLQDVIYMDLSATQFPGCWS